MTPSATTKTRHRIGLTQELIVFVVAVLLFLYFSVALNGFLSPENILNLIRNVAMLGMLSLGMAVVVIGRGVDLSLVAVMAVSLTLSIVLANQGYAFSTALALGLAFAVAVAVVMGFLIAYVEIPAIFATLAVSAIVYGLGRGVIASLDVNNIPDNLHWFLFLGRGAVLGIPMPIWLFAICSAALYLFLRKTGLGRFIYGIGDNISTARITGIPVRPIIILQYVISSAMAFLAGCATAASVASMNMRMVNSTLIYDVLLVVILGGIGLTGGRGGVRNILVGTILIGLLLNGMTILNISYTVQNLLKSTVLLLALVIDALLNPRDEQTSQQGDI
ncbi:MULTISPECIES: ABC transporter permease [unclassified Mesorhizobium]|uniref:ABC transporter permease n=1 Tax=unclassified Mesorhizobium TaxID=325217 RepID=UPI00112EEF53|nr:MULTISPECIES: ABC transporter permease [unclassified Mesorhizobium]TPL01605.1 ABC transporter permease [Mesorhizobium sp. B2-4-16]TPL71343.1 ABC transporter permease [Mesorhizobium sp. B2-4-3]